jgi:hypothetical protein
MIGGLSLAAFEPAAVIIQTMFRAGRALLGYIAVPRRW